jgi:hypothetical protein
MDTVKSHWWLLVVLVVFSTVAAHGAGLVKNSDFVTRVEGNAARAVDWTVSADAATAYSVVDDDGYKDSFSLHYKGEAQRKVGPVTQAVTLQRNTDYVLVAALKSDGTLKPAVRIVGPQGQLAVVVSDGSNTWTPFSARFNSGAATAATIEAFGDAGLTAQGPFPGGASAIDAVQVYLPNEVPATAKAEAAFVAPGPNVALGKPYTLQPAPSYGLSADPGDKTQLTDGEYTVGYFWAQKTTVGWSGANPVIISIDLGKVEPIAGMGYDTAAGVAGVTWPTSILIMVSDDGKSWTAAGDLITLAGKTSTPPPPTPYKVHKFATDQIKTHGRFVRLYVEQTPYAFVDEVEVYQGPQTFLQVPLGPAVDDPLKLFNDRIVYGGMMWRLRTDLSLARKAIAESKLSEAQKAALLDKANALAPRIETLPTEVPKSFRTVLPLNDLHAEIYALYAPMQRAQGLKPLTVWTNSRWDMLQPTQAPEKQPAAPSLAVRMMQREYRGATFNLSNTSDSPMNVTFNISGLPGGVNPDYISVRDIPFTDTRDRVPVADALPEIRAGANGYRVTIPAGMAKQIWLDFRPMDVKPGDYKGEIALRSARADNVTIPLSFRLQSQVFPARPTIHIGGWDYLETLSGQYDAVPTNVPDFLKVLPANYVDTPWAGGGVQPSGATFDPDGRLAGELKFTNWDRWIGLWPGARRYAVFLSVGDSFAGEKMGTPRFNKMVGDWITAWVEHMKTQNLQPEQLVLLLWDEPNQGDMSKTQLIKLWAQAINAVQPQVTLFEDPTYSAPQDVKDGFWDEIDVICPNLPMFLAGDQAFRDFYVNMGKAGKEMWFYSCSGPSKLLDPITYHRSQFWQAARYGWKGSFYWAFGDEAGGSSWNAYLQKRAQYSPLFVDPSGVTDAKHMAAIREGAQDYEYFVMLNSRIAELEKKGVKSPVLQQAKQLASDGPEAVTEQITTESLPWEAPKDRDMMDKVRVQVLEMLDKLAKL